MSNKKRPAAVQENLYGRIAVDILVKPGGGLEAKLLLTESLQEDPRLVVSTLTTMVEQIACKAIAECYDTIDNLRAQPKDGSADTNRAATVSMLLH